ncbi:hypothetical protein [uncultured Psychromonas sp.]|uniref:hypothetical protein n=1 Tax=uncultured Psychromonas sp. TaxID=173974 RepID=UPI00261E67B4|nr:hypothetical protein [uncultured Psychromonas sp.]
MKYSRRLKAENVGLVENQAFDFTWRQHFLTYATMKKFCDEKGNIFTFNKSSEILSHAKLKRNEPGAVSVRGWTQEVEKDISHPIENRYLEVIDKLINTTTIVLSSSDNSAVLEYLALWSARFKYRNNDGLEFSYGNWPRQRLNLFQKQCLEQRKTHQAGTMQEHEYNSLYVKSLLKEIVKDLRGIHLSIHRIKCNLNLVLPDKTNLLCIPVSSNIVLLPRECYFDGSSPSSVSKLNWDIMNQSHEYFWVKDISKVLFL